MRLFLAAINLFSTTYRFFRCTFSSNMSGASSTLTQHQGNERAVLNACWFFAFEAYYSREGVMYLIWILMGLPIASLLCAAFMVMRDGKVAPAGAAVRPAQSPSGVTPLSEVTKGSDWSSERTVQALIGI